MVGCFKSAVIGLLVAMWATISSAEEIGKEQLKALDQQTQDIKSEVLDISKNLVLLEDKVIYPPSTQLSIFLSVAQGDKSRLDDVKINIDGKEAAHHVYSSLELGALQHGGVQRIYVGNVQAGEHALEVALSGKAENNAGLQKKAGYKFNKGSGTKLIEIVLAGSIATDQVISFRD